MSLVYVQQSAENYSQQCQQLVNSKHLKQQERSSEKHGQRSWFW